MQHSHLLLSWWVLVVLTLWAGALNAEPLSAARRSELVNMVKHDCGSCHGLHLTGGLGPPLTAQALRGKSDAALQAVILNGRRETPMPPFAGILQPAEVAWLVQHLRKGGGVEK